MPMQAATAPVHMARARTQPQPMAARLITRRSAAPTEHRRLVSMAPPPAKPATVQLADIRPAAVTDKRPAQAMVPAVTRTTARRTPVTVLARPLVKAVPFGARPRSRQPHRRRPALGAATRSKVPLTIIAAALIRRRQRLQLRAAPKLPAAA